MLTADEVLESTPDRTEAHVLQSSDEYAILKQSMQNLSQVS